MKRFLRSLCLNSLTVFAILSFAFFLIHLVPGDPVDFILKDSGTLQDKIELRSSLGLDKPVFTQYLHFLKDLLRLDMGQSLLTGEPVFQVLIEQSAFTMRLAFLALLLALSWGICFGVFSVKFQSESSLVSNSKMGWWLRSRGGGFAFDIFPVLLFSVPAFVLAPLLTGFFSIYLRWFPVSGAGNFSHLVLPSLSLALPLGAVLMKITRTALLEASHLDCVRTARAKGLSPNRIYYRHILFNALVPIISIAGLQLGALLTGTVIIETLFDRPGLGTVLYRSILNRDYALVKGAVLWIALLYVLINRATDSLYLLVNPQMGSDS